MSDASPVCGPSDKPDALYTLFTGCMVHQLVQKLDDNFLNRRSSLLKDGQPSTVSYYLHKSPVYSSLGIIPVM